MQVFQNHIALSILLLLLPLFSAVLSLFVSKKLLKITVPAVLGVTVLTGIYFFFSTWGMEPEEFSVQWFSVSSQFSFEAGILIDKYTSIMILIVTSISFLVHLYSLGYMAEDAGIKKYFGFLGLFTFTMLGIVLVNNLFLLFIFWELVGFTSYLLIGFWYEKDSASKASKKAFLVNKIGDAGYLVGLMIVFASFGTFTFTGLEDLVNSSAAQTGLVTWAGLCFFMGTMAKSAQFPLYVWLPDAMEGPTPVSAMIHAATMVAAGVFLLARLEFLLTPDALSVIAVFGAITALLGGYSAINQRDIKKILAFSTISQLGYMVMGIGVGGSSTGMFHLFTHAVFKAGLFLSAGAIIHAMHEAIHKSG
ncbi:MAG: NADH-quinone oxidoreductase subunit L, partial [Cyclobacteriaceae bacterium]|nr:NADH-quinone oxidoreductase subunit L [Cyclobacteriaceae bacterium]